MGTFLIKVDIWVLCRVGIWAVNAPQGTAQHGPGNVGPDHCNLWSLWFNKAKKSHLQNSFYSNMWNSVVCCFFQQSLWFRLWSMLLCKSVVNSCGFSWVQQKSGPGPLWVKVSKWLWYWSSEKSGHLNTVTVGIRQLWEKLDLPLFCWAQSFFLPSL